MEHAEAEKGIQERKTSRRLRQAVDHVSHLWFPINEDHFKKIRNGLAQGVYDLDVEFLIQEIRKDFSLFMFCVRELATTAAKERRIFPVHTSAVDILRLSGLSRLKKILSVEARKISIHSLPSSTEAQGGRLREAMISASAAEVLAEHSNVDPLLGYGGALLRQLGLTLIAWNYPTVFKKVTQSLEERNPSDLDLVFSETLGFSPTLLGVALAREWNLPPSLSVIMGDIELEQSSPPDTKFQVIADTIRKVCEVGEALARANAPEIYPSARADWTFAKRSIEEKLGFEGVKILQDRARENCEQYLAVAPETFRTALELNAEPRLQAREEGKITDRNPYVRSLPPELRKLVREVYLRINDAAASKETLRKILKEVVPAAGFVGGIVYTVDPALGVLVPRTKIMETVLRIPETIQLKPGSGREDSVLAAFRCSTPLVESGDNNITMISAVLGEEQRVGVLYLESSQSSTGEEGERLVLAFKAIKGMLSECLGLR